MLSWWSSRWKLDVLTEEKGKHNLLSSTFAWANTKCKRTENKSHVGEKENKIKVTFIQIIVGFLATMQSVCVSDLNKKMCAERSVIRARPHRPDHIWRWSYLIASHPGENAACTAWTAILSKKHSPDLKLKGHLTPSVLTGSTQHDKQLQPPAGAEQVAPCRNQLDGWGWMGRRWMMPVS